MSVIKRVLKSERSTLSSSSDKTRRDSLEAMWD